jgi:molecular chaperone DnaJ
VLTRASRDYYAVLGVPRSASADTIKKSFRALASRYHPDVSSEPEAADRFLEIAEAYEVLSNAELRARYDRRGFATAASLRRPARPASEQDPLDGLFDATAGPAGRRGQRGRDILVGIELELEEARRGAFRGVRYDATSVCGECDGEGARPGSRWRACVACRGSGRVREVARAGGGRRLRLRACARCDGLGRLVDDPCAVCRGHGRLEEERALLVRFPAGAADGDELRLERQGHAGGKGGEPGDVVVRIRVRRAEERSLLKRLFGAG